MRKKYQHITIMRPFAFVHNTLTGLGFVAIGARDRTLYRISLRDSTTQLEYPLQLTTFTSREGRTLVKLSEAAFMCGDVGIPLHIMTAAECKLLEAAEYLLHSEPRPASTSAKLEANLNGSMAQDEQEMRQLGKEMGNMKTNAEVKADGMVPDPMQ
ncbi:MAG: hypothetical protein J7639_18255 [Paenibacillaceae bacterium]|nr:hypothetical protein [Paenibacillaceae bacterium]